MRMLAVPFPRPATASSSSANVVAYDICARMTYLKVSLERAAHDVVIDKLVQQKGEGGIIALDA